MKVGSMRVPHNTHYINTPVGNMQASATTRSICYLSFADHKNNTLPLTNHIKKRQIIVIPEKNAHVIQLKKELQDYFLVKRQSITVAIDVYGTLFQKKVWTSLATIPYARTWSYKQQTSNISSKAIRAAANTNRLNPLSILIPCHRVIAKNGDLRGYSGGLW